MCIPLVMAALNHSGNEKSFAVGVIITEASAILAAAISFRHRISMLTPRQMFLITSSVWILISFAGAIPLFLISHISFTDAVFESVSGLTTTGSTVLTGLDAMPHDLLVWRSMLQWIGGLGVIGMAVAILPFLKVGGMRLFQTESSDWSDKALPRARSTVSLIIYFYLALTILCSLAYMFDGMDAFHAINHAMTTISTGGFSTSDNSFAQFADLPSHWIAIVFMMLGSLPFVLYIQSFMHRRMVFLHDQQVRGFLYCVLVFSVGMSIYLWREGVDLPHAITLSTFNLVSVITTTGYASGDYSLWGPLAVVIFFFATFVGGCSGSTAGGVKIFRFQILAMLMRENTRRALHPRAVIQRRYNNQVVDDAVVLSTASFIFIMILTLAVITLLLASSGLDLVTAFTAASTSLMNVGPGLGDIIGPAGNFASLTDSSKWILCLGMLLGRLEFVTLLILFSPDYWRA
ncbi:TrkH family potassium uptake protein [Spongiibacter sp. KMU-158]|uniref:Trk system potassium uptake protein n=2 Tax=Spongiibacter pelagi TaxID=2760804 RepID=A0A927C110_9GAMM|nr:TrkH family potassium uptake protein [Spongiibacter pelagi]